MENELILAVSNQYIMKYYEDPLISELPDDIKNSIKIIMVNFTEECGGILELIFNNEFNDLSLKSYKEEVDFTYDDIEANYKLAKIEKEYEEFLKELANYIKLKLETLECEEHEHECDCGHDHSKECNCNKEHKNEKN